MKHAHDMDLRDMLDETARMLGGYETEAGTKQSFGYEVQLTYHSVNILKCINQMTQVRHFYKKLYFNPGLCWDPVDTMGSNVIKEDVTGEMTVEESVREAVAGLKISKP